LLVIAARVLLIADDCARVLMSAPESVQVRA
jgi:hypothetical protein